MIAPGNSHIRHFFTVDVEEYFQVSAFDDVVSRETWPAMPSRVSESVGIVLELLSRRGVQGTFFTLGWVAKRHPAVIRRIVDAGHEIASHGWWHQKVTSLSEPQFREDVRRAKDVLEDITGRRVLGYRAPSFSIVPGLEWAFDVLIEEGYVYDSSIFPVRRAGYGYPGATPIAHVIDRPSGRLYRVPAGDPGVEWSPNPRCGRRLPPPFPVQCGPASLSRARRREATGRVLYTPLGTGSRATPPRGSPADSRAALPGTAWNSRAGRPSPWRIPLYVDLPGSRTLSHRPHGGRSESGGREVRRAMVEAQAAATAVATRGVVT